MNNVKKYSLFYGVMALLILAFVAGAGYAFYIYSWPLKSARVSFERAANDYNKARNADPSAEQVELSKQNIAKLEEKLNFLIKDLSRASSQIVKKCPYTQGFELVEGLRGFVNKWKQTAKNAGIKIADDMDFSFKRYYTPGSEAPKDAAIVPLWKQASVLDYILGKLFNSKPQDMEMGIISVERENVPEEGIVADPRGRGNSARSREDKGEVFTIDPLISARVKGSLDTLAYRFVFTGQTEVLRLFLNQLKSFDAMLVVRSIEVKPAENTDASFEGASDTAVASSDPFASLASQQPAQDPAPVEGAAADGSTPDPSGTPVVTNNTSEFTVVIEYLEVVKDAPKAEAAEGEAPKAKAE